MKTKDYLLDEHEVDQSIFEETPPDSEEESGEIPDQENENAAEDKAENEKTELACYGVRVYELQVYRGSQNTATTVYQPDRKKELKIVPEEPNPVPEEKTVPASTMTSILAGLGVLLFIMLISIMVTIAPMITGAGQNDGLQYLSEPGSSSPDGVQGLPLVAVTPASLDTPASPVFPNFAVIPDPVVTPEIPTMLNPQTVKNAIPQPVQNTIPQSFVTLESALTPVPTQVRDLSVNIPLPSTKDYFTIYSLENQPAQQNLPYVSFNLVNPPVVIDYQITPFNITDVKEHDFKVLSTAFSENITIDRAYEQSWFRVLVLDRNTGAVVLDDGYGKEYSHDLSRELTVYQGGNYTFQFSGEYADVNLTMKVKKEGNIN